MGGDGKMEILKQEVGFLLKQARRQSHRAEESVRATLRHFHDQCQDPDRFVNSNRLQA